MTAWDALTFIGAAVATFFAIVLVFQCVDERWHWRVVGRGRR